MNQFKTHCTVLNGSTYSYCGLLDYNTRTHQHLHCRWKQDIPWRHLHPSTALHAVISQRTTIWQYCNNYLKQKNVPLQTQHSHTHGIIICFCVVSIIFKLNIQGWFYNLQRWFSIFPLIYCCIAMFCGSKLAAVITNLPNKWKMFHMKGNFTLSHSS